MLNPAAGGVTGQSSLYKEEKGEYCGRRDIRMEEYTWESVHGKAHGEMKAASGKGEWIWCAHPRDKGSVSALPP